MGVVHLILIFMTAKDVVTLFGGYLEATLTAAIIYRPKVSSIAIVVVTCRQ